jgi:hypothetical protein
VAKAGQKGIPATEITVDRLGFGGRFNDYDVGHFNLCGN